MGHGNRLTVNRLAIYHFAAAVHSALFCRQDTANGHMCHIEIFGRSQQAGHRTMELTKQLLPDGSFVLKRLDMPAGFIEPDQRGG